METYNEDSKLDNPASVYRVCVIRLPHGILFSSCRLVRAQSQSLSWLAPILNHLGLSGGIQPQQDQPSSPSPPTTLPAPAPAPPVPASPPAAVPASPAPPKCPPQPQLQDDAVGKLLEDNDDVFDRLINHPFPRALGDGSASLDGFRYFMIVSHS